MDADLEQELQRQLTVLGFGVTEITPESEFKEMLRESIKEKTPLRVKCGIDPTGSDIHLGHLVPFRKMRQFQDLGHLGVVIIGDYTASIGDPTGKNESRPSLDLESIQLNAKRYMEQVYTVVDRDRTEVCFQTEWFADASLKDVIQWSSQTTVAKLLSHETFSKRLEEGQPLSLHEMLYPVLQGIDSVYVKADVELGGSDQKFNVLMGRDYQRFAGQRPQVAMLLPIITGTCGTQKMSKSLGNYIGILDEPFDKFGKVMSIPDELMIDYFKYLTDQDPAKIMEIEAGLNKGILHPNRVKKDLASLIVSFFHGEEVAVEMLAKFENVFKKGQVPEDVQEVALTPGLSLVQLLLDTGLLTSKGEGRRLIKQNAIGIVDGDKVSDPEMKLEESIRGRVIKVGKRKFLKII